MKQKGFSLLEIITVIFIISVLLAVAVNNFSEVRKQLALKRAAHQMLQDFREAQEMAISSRQTEDCGDLSAKGYGLYINIQPPQGDNRSYILYADTAGDDEEEWEYYTPADCVIKTITIAEKGVIIQEIQNTDPNKKVSINFKPPNPNVNIKWLQPSKDEVKIVLALDTDSSKTITVAVNRAGVLEVK